MVREALENELDELLELYLYLHEKSVPEMSDHLKNTYDGVFNVLIGPITEELFFRGYLTSHYKKQSSLTPIIIGVLFSLLMQPSFSSEFYVGSDGINPICNTRETSLSALQKKNRRFA